MANTVNNPSGGSVDGGGARPFDLSREQVLSIALEDYRKNLPTPDNDGIAIAVKPTDANVQLQNRLVIENSNTLTAEDKFYESLGIKKSSGGWGIQSRPMGRLLVAVVLVGGYFAYKKFKK